MYKRLLIPFDGPPLAEQALPHAIAQARHFEAESILLQVLAPMPHSPLPGDTARGRALTLLSASAREYLEGVVSRVQKHGIGMQAATAEGNLPGAITEFAEANDVSLIVMSTRGQSSFSCWLMGSVADRVVRGASVPVLLVRASRNASQVSVAEAERMEDNL